MVASRGVPLGLFNDIPRVRPVYDENPKVQPESGAEVRWLESEGVRDNYSSAEDHMAKVEEHLEEDLKKGWLVKMSLKVARELYQGLQLAALGAVPKDPAWEDIRVVHDGTHGFALNKEIKQPNRMAFPQFDEHEGFSGRWGTGKVFVSLRHKGGASAGPSEEGRLGSPGLQGFPRGCGIPQH